MRKESKIPTLFGLLLLVLSVAVGVFLAQQNVIFRLGASPNEQPLNVRITNISDTSFTVSWTTYQQNLGAVIFGTSSSLEKTIQDNNSPPTSAHHVSLTNLKPQTTYYFKILSGKTVFGQKGSEPWKQTTGPKLPSRTSEVLSGVVKTQTGEPAERVLVYITLPDSSALSDRTDESGAYNIILSNIRVNDLHKQASYNNRSILAVFAQSGAPQEDICCSSAQVTVANARPLPPITLGQTHDFTKTASSTEFTSPRTNLQISSQSVISSPNKPSPAPVMTNTPSPLPQGGLTYPTATPTLKPSVKPSTSPTAKPIASLTPLPQSTSVSLPSTPGQMPTAGDLTITVILFILGLGFLSVGIFVMSTYTHPT